MYQQMRRGKDGGGSDCKRNSIVFPIVNRFKITINHDISICFDCILTFSMIKNIFEKNMHFHRQKIISFAHINFEFLLQISRSQDPPVCPLSHLVVGLFRLFPVIEEKQTQNAIFIKSLRKTK